METEKLEKKIKELNEKIENFEKHEISEVKILLRSIIEIPDDTIIYAVDKNLNFLAFNNNYQTHIKKITKQKIYEGQNIIEALKDYRKTENLENDLKRALKGEEFFHIGDFTKDSQKYYFKDIYRPLFNHKNEIIGVIVYYTNITELTRSEKTWKILIQIYEKIHQVENVEELIGFVHSKLSKIIDTTNFYVALYDENKDIYSFPYYIDKFDEISKIQPQSLKKSLTDYVRRSGTPLLLNETIDNELTRSGEVEIVGTPSASWLGVPLKIGEKSIGVLVIQNYNSKGVFSEKDLELMAFISEHIAMALERKRFEQELQENAKDLRIAKNKAEESDRLKSAFLANMSHEIRTPLNAIMGFTKLLSKHSLKEEQQKEYLQYIENSGNNLLSLINDLLDVAKIESGQSLIKKSVCKLNKLLDELFNTFSKQKFTKNKDHINLLLIKANDNPDFSIIVDAQRLRQIFANLIGNSFKFIDFGTIEFGYKYKDKETLLFWVKDTGIGIPDDKTDIIFSRFGQIVGSEIRNPGGTGLGLSITKHLVEEMGGEIWFESQVGKGTTFSFILPLVESDVIANNDDTSDDCKQYDLSKLKILVVEDDVINTTLLIDTLRLYQPDLHIDTADDGDIGIEKIKKNDYDIVIMDIRMPNINGNEATKIIRKLPKPKCDVPIIGLSAHAMKIERDKSLEAGMNVFLTKPIVEKEIIHHICSLTGISSSETKTENSNIEIVTNEVVDEKTLSFQHIDLSLLNQMYRGDKRKVNNILKLCKQNIPKQINDIKKFNENKNWEQLKITSHSMKSTFNYIGLEELKVLAKTIEDYSAKKEKLEKIPELISQITSIWSLAEEEIERALS